ncbi:MAG: hypothetical protein H0T68_00185 [Gemmatimonadales bacterium]|nr:hypothetical protein [Gemmatimonadales bacterium]
MRILGAVVALLVSMPLLFGCASRGQAAEGATSSQDAEVALEVESHNWSDVVIYLMRGSSSHRLGTVTALSTNRFVFPYRHLGGSGSTRLRAYSIGGAGDFLSEDLLIQPGQWIKWTLESDLSRSSLAVY